jgi:hypothetical protein
MNLRAKPTSLISVLAAAAALAIGATGVAHAQKPQAKTPAPIGVAEEAVVSGKVVDVDPQSKAVLVQGPRGNLVELVAGDEAKNIGNVRKGDIVTLRAVRRWWRRSSRWTARTLRCWSRWNAFPTPPRAASLA